MSNLSQENNFPINDIELRWVTVDNVKQLQYRKKYIHTDYSAFDETTSSFLNVPKWSEWITLNETH
jgi:hypothetical protein